MYFFRQILSLSIILLLSLNLFAIFVLTGTLKPTISHTHLIQSEDNQNKLSPDYVPKEKIGSEIISGNTTLKTDKDSYAPGEWVEITVESTTLEMNGSLEWSLESPISEMVFDYSSDFQDIFDDRFFDGPTIPDWTNDSFSSYAATSGYLNLTEVADSDKKEAEIYFYTPELDTDRYEISFDYFSEGQNLLLNPGFEGGNTTGWDFNSSLVKAVEDPNNASEGSYYTEINGTEGYLLNQTVDVVEGIHEVILVVKATGNTDENFWSMRLESYNSTGSKTGEIEKYPSSDSRSGTPDEKGYITQMIYWTTPDNTTKLRVAFEGKNATDLDALYSGWLDDCYLYEVPPDLLFSYWYEVSENVFRWENITLDSAKNREWVNKTFKIDMVKNDSKTFRLILPDDNSFANNATSYWFIDNIKVNRVTVPADIMGPIVKSPYKETFSGNINSSWIHPFREIQNLSSTYKIEVEPWENETTPSDCYALIQVQLPEYQVYFGSWIFVFQIHRIDNNNQFKDTKFINISFVVKEQMNYVVQDIYMLRGSTNETQGSDSQYIFTEYFEKESRIQALSPGDNVTLYGFIEANSTRGDWYSLDYLEIGSASVEYHWDSGSDSRENITWNVFGFIPYNNEGETILDGNFSSPFNNATTMALNFELPMRGMYGNLSANLSITLIGTNTKPGGVGGDPLTLIIPLDLPPVKYKISIIEQHLPAANYYITDYLGGNITFEFLNYNDTLESNFPNRTISVVLSIPMSDLELTIFLDNLDQTPSKIDISQQFHYHYIGKSVLWLDRIDPSLKNGNYSFRIRWNAPYNLGVFGQDILVSYSIQIRGSPIVIPAEESPGIKQGEQKSINFTVHIDNATGKFIRGLDLMGLMETNQSYRKFTIYEEEGVYKIDLDIERDTEVKEYSIDIYIAGRSETIGKIKYSVIEVPKEIEDPPTPLDIVVDFGGFLFFILVSLGVIGALYWANKSLA